jgi:hypothetical protein
VKLTDGLSSDQKKIIIVIFHGKEPWILLMRTF